MIWMQTILVGSGLAYCGFLLGKNYWQSKILEFLAENQFIKIDSKNNELISWDKSNRTRIKKIDN